MISFYPGPSRVYPKVSRYMQDAYREGVLSINHRSDAFVEMSQKAMDGMRKKLRVPKNYTIYFLTSATECWEVIAESFVRKESIHIYNGAFGEKWCTYSEKLVPAVARESFSRETLLHADQLKFKKGDLICITQNETSNGTQVSTDIIKVVKKNNPNHLVAVDATSSMAGIMLDFSVADIWFASVQKCFGLPAGLAVMICSPHALERAQSINNRKHYNSILFLNEMIKKAQTPCTPNVLNIYLLMRVMADVKEIDSVHRTITGRFKKWETFFDLKSNKLDLLVKNPSARSHTVLPIESTPVLVDKIKTLAAKKGFLLGDGYGELKTTTFRIANFPSLRKSEIARLMDFLYDFI
ncbi:MAG: alanine--glyoxylate aminotransferase family protein [Cyclobacteriaceae bacterium]|nr:alanine--glyoxylate aminotransferase family protein [Cyclobacteriaceae bacterium]